MSSRSELMKDTVRPIAIAVVSVGFGSLLVLALEIFLDLEVSTLTTSIVTFVFAAFAAFFLFPRILRLPFRDVGWSEYMHRLGFYVPQKVWKHVLLGIFLSVCTFSGMLIGSLLSGRYELDWSTVNISHILFSINPGLWEEFFYRGVIMLLLLRVTKSVRRAALIQIVLFGLSHIKAFDLWSWVDVISVMVLALAFTYTAYKTRTLVAGIVFHFLHDTFLLLPQVPGGEYIGVFENVTFFASLWLLVGVGCIFIKFLSDGFGVMAGEELYAIEHASSV
jgi:membrane protease YdiL (CAAX protease family)